MDDITRKRLINALCAEWDYCLHNVFEVDGECMNLEEYRLMLECYNDDDLLNIVDDVDHYLNQWGVWK